MSLSVEIFNDVCFQHQPKKHKTKGDSYFDDEFKFLNIASEYNHDTWDDLQKYIKRKGTNRTDEKIEKSRRYVKSFVSVLIYDFQLFQI